MYIMENKVYFINRGALNVECCNYAYSCNHGYIKVI